VKPLNPNFMIGILLIGISLGGCAMVNNGATQPVQNGSPTLSAENVTPAAIATHTPNPMPTLPSLFSPTPSISPTSTQLIIPTLPMEEARLKLLDLLSKNGDCHLPCIWGITPGNSTYEDAQRVLIPLSSTSSWAVFNPGIGGIDLNFLTGDIKISPSISFITYPDNDIVSSIGFRAGAFKEVSDPNNPGFVFNSTLFGKTLAFYMVPHILSEYGEPSSVLLRTNPGPNERGEMGLFNFILMYPDQGFLIQYTTIMRMSGANVLGCPVNAHVTLNLYPSGHADAFYELIGPGWNDVLVPYKQLEEVTSMSLDQFYQTFQKPTDQCIVTASTNWPEPER
jgi:hypothetical protein